MRPFLNTVCVVLILIGLNNRTLISQETDPPSRNLQVEVSSDSVRDSRFFPEVTHVAEFHVVQDRKITMSWLSTIEDTPQWLKVSEAQRTLVLEVKRRRTLSLIGKSLVTVGRAYRSSKTPQGAVSYHIWGASAEDAKILAEAFIEKLDQTAAEKHEAVKQEIDHLQSTLLEADRTIPDLESECERLKKDALEHAEAYSQKYSLVDSTPNYVLNHAASSHEDASSHLREIRIGLLGLSAKQEAIRNFKSQGKIKDKATLLRLDQLLVVNEIDQIGALARKSAYTEILTQTQLVLQSEKTGTRAYSDLGHWTTKQTIAKDKLEKLEKEIKNPPANGQAVTVHDNLIRIRPVRH